MSKSVRVAPGYNNVPLFSGVLNQGQILTLTDSQYNALPSFIRQQLMVVSSIPDGNDLVVPDKSYTFSLISSMLRSLGVPLMLSWDGTQYQPAQYTGDMTRVKFFVGPVDPSNLPGVLLNINDQWVSQV